MTNELLLGIGKPARAAKVALNMRNEIGTTAICVRAAIHVVERQKPHFAGGLGGVRCPSGIRRGYIWRHFFGPPNMASRCPIVARNARVLPLISLIKQPLSN